MSSQIVTVLVTVLSPPGLYPPGAVMVLNTVMVSISCTVMVYPALLFNVTVFKAVIVVVARGLLSIKVTVRRRVTVAVYGTATLRVAVLTTVRVKVLSFHSVVVLKAVVVSSFVTVAQSVTVNVRPGRLAVAVTYCVCVR